MGAVIVQDLELRAPQAQNQEAKALVASTCSLHCSSFFGLRYRIQNIRMVQASASSHLNSLGFRAAGVGRTLNQIRDSTIT